VITIKNIGVNTKFQKQDVNNDIIFVMQQNSVIVYRGHPEKVTQFIIQIKSVYIKKLCLKTKNIGAVALVCSMLVRLANGLQ